MTQMINSGIEWVGDIPEHWEILPNKYIMHKFKDICLTHTDEDIISLTKKGVIIRDLSEGGKMPATFDGYQRVYPGNLLMCLFDIDVTPRCVGIIKNEGLTSPAYSQFVLNDDVDVSYYYYYYLMLDEDKTLLHLSKNLRHSLTEDQLGRINIIKPPVLEQKKISKFLNKNVTIIDNIINESLILIEKYKEYKQSLITETVTKSLNKNVGMKESDIDWIGEIPEHWKTIKLKRCCEKITDGSHHSPDTTDEGKYYITVRNIIDDKIDFKNAPKISFEDYISLKNNGCQPEKNDVLLSKDGSIGKCIVVDENIDFVILSSLGLLKPNNLVISEYLRYFLISDMNIEQMYSYTQGSAIKRLTVNIIKNLFIILPPIDEQKEIIKYLDAKCKPINKSIIEKENLVKKLEEYKKSLIFEYVTGKKEVPYDVQY